MHQTNVTLYSLHFHAADHKNKRKFRDEQKGHVPLYVKL